MRDSAGNLITHHQSMLDFGKEDYMFLKPLKIPDWHVAWLLRVRKMNHSEEWIKQNDISPDYTILYDLQQRYPLLRKTIALGDYKLLHRLEELIKVIS